MPNCCQVCFSQEIDFVRRVKSPYLDIYYSLFQCNSCLSRFFDADENQIDLKDFYAKRAAEERYLAQKFKKCRYWANEVRVIRKLLGRMPDSILDVGCRTGDFLLHWPDNIEKLGIELSEPSAILARSRGLSIFQERIEDVSLERTFEVISCYALLEHLEKPKLFLEKFAGMVSEGGLLIVMVPSHQSVKAKLLEKFERSWHMYSPPAHFCFYSREFLLEFFGNRGFELLKIKYTSGGMFNPFYKVPKVRSAFRVLFDYFEYNLPFNKLAIFDHMYLYFKK